MESQPPPPPTLAFFSTEYGPVVPACSATPMDTDQPMSAAATSIVRRIAILPGYFATADGADAVKVHDTGAVSAVGVMCSGVTLFLVSKALKATKSTDCIAFQATTVAVYSLQPASHVSICDLLGAMSMPFCDRATRVLKLPFNVLNEVTLPGAPPPRPPRPPPPPPRPPRPVAPPNVPSLTSRSVTALATSVGIVPAASAATCARTAATSSLPL